MKIIINGKDACIEELINKLTYEDGEIDFDTLGAAMDSDILQSAMDSFDKSYDMYELIERYMSLSDKPLEVTI